MSENLISMLKKARKEIDSPVLEKMLELVTLQIEDFLKAPPSSHDRIAIPLNQLEIKIVNFQL